VPQVAAAKAICRGCPVCAECLDYAMQTAQDHGIWGGTTDEERRVARRGQIARLAG
jgi:WhiB family redox-sensing transcriptional regulator